MTINPRRAMAVTHANAKVKGRFLKDRVKMTDAPTDTTDRSTFPAARSQGSESTVGLQYMYTWGDRDVISFHIYASWFSTPSCR